MAALPIQIEQRADLDCRLGIKSSLSDIAPVVALTYLLYCSSNKQGEIIYAKEVIQEGKTKLVLDEIFSTWIQTNYSVNAEIINKNPLLTSQLEALQVGLGLVLHIARLSYVDYPNTDTKERTGGNRYRKLMKFALNMRIIDLYLSSYNQEDTKRELILWLKNTPTSSEISKGLKNLLVIFSEETQFKLRNQGEEVIFQQLGIYKALTHNNSVIAKDDQEDVGPFRIFKSIIREGIHPFLSLNNNEFASTNRQDFDSYKSMVETSLALATKKTVIYQDVISQEKNHVTVKPTFQTIFYGAPGTGKSHKIKKYLEDNEVLKENVFRTTFHPDSDYSTFVGAYKPSMEYLPVRNSSGLLVKTNGSTIAIDNGSDDIIKEKQITYNFVPQVFLKAYVRAYQTSDNVYLVIEEINRGNCAQIFGDLFQLLDRNEEGYSDYTIKADEDLKLHLEKELGVGVSGIKDGELCLPPNLFIFATMNTSDQSLFPIDSAFKRRWDWEYEPIKYSNVDWKIVVGTKEYSWISFQKIVNDKIFDINSSEDKMLGDFFVNPSNGIITEKILLNKILFYLWNDVCKDGDGDIFKIADGKDVTFSELHSAGGAEKLIAMMDYLGVNLLKDTITEDLLDDNDRKEINDQAINLWYKDIWTDIIPKLRERQMSNLPNVSSRNYYQLGVGLTGISVIASMSKTKGACYVGYYIEKQQANVLYPKLSAIKDTLETKLGNLEWQHDEGKYAVVKISSTFGDLSENENRNNLVKWTAEKLPYFYKTIMQVVDSLR